MFSSARSKSDQTAEEETKTRPPYVEDAGAKEPFQPKYRGKCYCGAVEIAANSDPVVCDCTADISMQLECWKPAYLASHIASRTSFQQDHIANDRHASMHGQL